MKKIVLITAVIAAGTLIAGDAAYAFGGGGAQCGREGRTTCQAPREKLGRDLGLTEDQEARLTTAREAHFQEMQRLRTSTKEKERALREAIAKPDATRDTVAPLVGEIKDLRSRMVDQRVEGIFEVKGILSQEQFAKLGSLVEKHRRKLLPRLTLIIKSRREVSTVSHAELARIMLDAVFNEVFT